jgi:predicted MFS family arabinose efflux permease
MTTAAVSTKPTWYHWLIVAFSMWTQAITAGCTVYSYGLISLAMNKDFGASRAWASGGFTAMMVMLSLAGPYLGPLTDKLPPRRVLLIGLVSVTGGFMLLSFSQAMWQMTLIFATFMTVGQFFLGPVIAGVLVGRWFRQRSGLAFGISATGLSMGGIFYPPIVQFLIDHHGWRMMLLMLGGSVFIVTMIFLALLRRLDPDDSQIEDVKHKSETHKYGLIKNPIFWQISILSGVMTMAQMAMQINLVPFAETIGIAPMKSARFMTLMALGSVSGKLAIGIIADRSSIRLSMQLLIFLTAVSALVFLLWQNVSGLMLGAALVGMALGGLMPLMSSAIVRTFGAGQYGKAYGYIALVTLPCQLGPMLAAMLYDRFGSYNIGFMIFFVLLAITAPVSARLRS